MEHRHGWKKTVKLLILLALLAIGTAVYVSCGEENFPAPASPGTGTVIITGGAV